VAKEFNVSRAPAREALLRLEDVNLVRKNNLGREVVEFSIEEFREIYEVKNVLEAYAAMQATQTATERDMKKLHSILDEMNNNLNPPNHKKLIKLNNEFHDYIIHCSTNRNLIELYDIRVKQVRWTSVNYKTRPQLSVKEHDDIYAAFLRRDAQMVRSLMESHTMGSMERIISEMESKKRSEM
jgi:DNA-binding GntR family transcriptional regulator